MEEREVNEIVQFSSFITLPEIIIQSKQLRNSFSFLARRESTWNLFKEMLQEKENTQIDVFMRGFSKFQWRLHGSNLAQSLHTLRLLSNHNLFQRPIIPIVAVRKSIKTYSGEIIDVFEQIRIFPTCFCEYQMQITSPKHPLKNKNILTDIKQTFRNNLPEIQHGLSLALFGDERMVSTSFSDVFVTLIKISENPSGLRISPFDTEETTIKVKSNVIVETSPSNKRVFIDRVRDAISLALAYRVMIPVLWTTLLRLDFKDEQALREIIEIVFLHTSPKYYIHSDKLTPHILSKSYQRKAFEVLFHELELNSIQKKLRTEFIDWLDTIPLELIVNLLSCSQPLRGELARTLRKMKHKPVEFDLSPPTSTIFTYLTCAYLRDRYLMFESPDLHRFPKERIGLRTANQILNSAKKIENVFKIERRVEKDDIYRVPSKVLQVLMEIGIVISEETHKTSAPMAFRINPDSPTAIQSCLMLQNNNEITLLHELGI